MYAKSESRSSPSDRNFLMPAAPVVTDRVEKGDDDLCGGRGRSDREEIMLNGPDGTNL